MANDEAHLAWAVNLGVIDFNPHPVRRDDLDHPDELRVDLDPTPEVGWAEVRKTAMVVHEVLTEHGLRGYPKTSRLQGHPRQRADRADPGLHRGPPRGARAGARGRAPRARPGDEQVVEGGAPRRLRRLQPERARPHRRLRLLRAAHAGRARLLRAGLGRGPRRRARRPAARHRPGAPEDASATRRRTSTSSPARSTRCSTSRGATRRAGSATRPGRRTSRSSAASPSASSPRATPTARPSAAAPATRSPAARRPGFSLGRPQRGFGSKPRTGQGYEDDWEEKT